MLAGIKVAGFLRPERDFPFLLPGDPLATVLDRFAAAPYPVLPVVDPDKRLQGVVVLDEVHMASQAGTAGTWLLAADLMRTTVAPLTPDDRLDKAMELFAENDLLVLPVINGHDGRQVVGLVRRSDLSQAYLRQLHGRPEAAAQT